MRTCERPHKIPVLPITDEPAGGRRQTRGFRDKGFHDKGFRDGRGDRGRNGDIASETATGMTEASPRTKSFVCGEASSC